MKKKNIWLLLIHLCFMSSCISTKQKGPYNLTVLTKLKNANESIYLVDYKQYHTVFFSDQRRFKVKMIYDAQNTNIICSDIIQNNYTYTEKEGNEIVSFLSNYYFISDEKLSTLFPPEKVIAKKGPKLGGNYLIKKFDSTEQIKQETNYYYFKYKYQNGYLFLASFKTYGITEENYLFEFDD